MKTYVLTISKIFSKTHKKAGIRTYFPEKIRIKQGKCEDCSNTIGINYCKNKCRRYIEQGKIHTIRTNYLFWKKRIKEIQEGKAILSIRYWSDKPYNSKQVEICQLDKDSGIGIQKIIIDPIYQFRIDNSDLYFGLDDIAKNDGLSIEDFKEWFKNYEIIEPMAIIHFTNFRY
jgi:hypothetical protein